MQASSSAPSEHSPSDLSFYLSLFSLSEWCSQSGFQAPATQRVHLISFISISKVPCHYDLAKKCWFILLLLLLFFTFLGGNGGECQPPRIISRRQKDQKGGETQSQTTQTHLSKDGLSGQEFDPWLSY